MPQLQKKHYWTFWVLLVVGIGLMIGLTDFAVTEHDSTAEVVFSVFGSMVTPGLYVYYLDLHNLFIDPRWRTILLAFVLGAVVGVPLAIVLEIVLPTNGGGFRPAFTVGLIEEFCKMLIVLFLLRKRYRYLMFEMDGIILGAAVGMGFAMLEDMLYASDAFSGGVTQGLAVVWLRAVLGAFGHGTWTAIVAGTIWRVKGSNRVHVVLSGLAAYLVAALLHGCWDWIPFPGFAAIFWWLGVGIVGILILRSMVHSALTQEKGFLERMNQPQAPAPSG